MNLCKKVSQGHWHMCAIHHTKLNCDKWHAHANPNLMKTQTRGVLSKVKELHQVDTSLELNKTINQQEVNVVK